MAPGIRVQNVRLCCKFACRLNFSGFLSSPLLILALFSVSTDVASDEVKAKVTPKFAETVYPILQRHCLECHGPKRQEGGLRLDSAEHFQDSGVIPSDPAQGGEFVRRLRLPTDDSERMPKSGVLNDYEIDQLTGWAAAGGPWPGAFNPPKHWAYQKPLRTIAPPPANFADRTPCINEIDIWIRADLVREGLKPAPEANPSALLRRVYFDLIGLPPTADEVESFVKNPTEQQYLKRVDDLLSRPQFGERWSRQWLDLARYADSHGFQRDDLRDLWAYRDWVIHAINDDMPFDQFTIEQLAGDLLPDAGQEQRIATGFHRCAPTNVEAGSLPEETRSAQLIDRVNTTATVWLGTTLQCAQCHDHKYDPFSTEDYYRFLSFFNGTAIEAELSDPKKPSSIAFVGPSLSLEDPDKNASSQDLKSLETRLKRRVNQLRKEIAGKIYQGSAFAAELKRIRANDPETVRLTEQIDTAKAKAEPTTSGSTLVMVETGMRPTHTFRNGDYRNPGELVTPGTPSCLHPMASEDRAKSLHPSAMQGADRLSLARWLVDRENPLVARVVVNRWWGELFGQGLVETPEDFGLKGASPSHPELLDQLAIDFMDSGWSMKRVLRKIVTSATYRQSAIATPEQLSLDLNNRKLARGPRLRLEAEMIRDNALAISGLLDLRMYGPPIRPHQPAGLWTKVGGQQYDYDESIGGEAHRRGIYIIIKRGSPYPSLVNFDATNRLVCTVTRGRTATPLQALTLLNDPVYVNICKAMASEATSNVDQAPEEIIEDWFIRCTARRPENAERELLHQLFIEQYQRAALNPKSASILAGEQNDESQERVAKFSAWFCVATTLLNLHETITKP
ncbi:MAG: hypothetical protein RI963_209 [Planctomycetota bacterium]|jgi:hypothetical protein